MRADKQLLLDEIQEKIEGSNSFLITRYEGLGANLANDFRRAIAEKDGNFEVVRKRILMKAAESVGLTLTPEMLEGHIALVLAGEDPIETTKTVFKFSADNADTFTVLGGRIDGIMYGADEVQKLSKLPGKDEMRAQFLGLLEAPMSQTLSVMQALLTSVMYCLENKAQQEGGE